MYDCTNRRLPVRPLRHPLDARRGGVACLRERDGGRESSDEPKIRAVVVVQLLGAELQRRPEIFVAIARIERWRQHTNDGVALVLETQRPTDERRIASKAGLPHAMVRDHDTRSTGHVVAIEKAASDRWRNAKHAEVVRGDASPADQFGGFRARECKRATINSGST